MVDLVVLFGLYGVSIVLRFFIVSFATKPNHG